MWVLRGISQRLNTLQYKTRSQLDQPGDIPPSACHIGNFLLSLNLGQQLTDRPLRVRHPENSLLASRHFTVDKSGFDITDGDVVTCLITAISIPLHIRRDKCFRGGIWRVSGGAKKSCHRGDADDLSAFLLSEVLKRLSEKLDKPLYIDIDDLLFHRNNRRGRCI